MLKVAAYFAASAAVHGAGSRTSHSGQLAVWALRQHALQYAETRFETVEAASLVSPRLKAQRGLFTTVRGQDAPVDMAQAFQEIADEEILEGFCPVLRRLTLPIEEAPKLLRLLSYEGVSAATLFPDYEGVTAAIREQLLWDKPKHTMERRADWTGWRVRPRES